MSADAALAAPPASTWRRMRVWATAHAIDDLYQGLVPTSVPYFVLERHMSYAGASGLALAAAIGSAVPQLAIGHIADRRGVPWLAPLGLAVAATGFGLAGVVHPYAAIWLLLVLSGLGVAMFHPPAGRDARRAAGTSATAMSYFAAGGSVGFFLGPTLGTPLLDAYGLGATVLLIAPGALMAHVLLRHQRRENATAGATRAPRPGSDRPGLFALLTAVEVVRSTISFGINTFVSLLWIRHLGASSALGGAALAIELGGGIVGTLIGGRIADRLGLVRAVQTGNVLLVPALVALLACHDRYAALGLVAVVGLVTNIPFAVLIKLGQDYLPSRPGTAAGITLGLAISAGGLFQPVLGTIADHHGPQGAFAVLAVLPVVAIAMSLRLREPASSAAAERSAGLR